MSTQNNCLIAHSDAVSIELLVRNILQCDRGGYGGLVEADVYERYPLEAAIACVVSLYSQTMDDKVNSYIDVFFSRWRNATPEQYRESYCAELENLVNHLKENTKKP